jgi:hypothetical protein
MVPAIDPVATWATAMDEKSETAATQSRNRFIVFFIYSPQFKRRQQDRRPMFFAIAASIHYNDVNANAQSRNVVTGRTIGGGE